MTFLKTAAFGLIVSATVAGSAFAQPMAKPMAMSMEDKQMMTGCMAMAPSAMEKNPGCMSMMKKMKMSNADMKKMMSCRAMAADMMMKDKMCMSMKEMHPDMMAMPMATMPMKK